MRIDQFIQLAMGISRRDAQRLLRKGEITLNRRVIKQSREKVDRDNDQICYQRELLHYNNSLSYFLLHKPLGYVSSHRDDGNPSLFRLLRDDMQSLHIAGRLDADTTGLLLLTDDGDFSHYLTHPKRSIPKKYLVSLADNITPTAIGALEKGVYLHGDDEKTLPAEVKIRNPKEIDLIIVEGRYHQVKRMLAAVGNRVIKLHRYQIGSIALDGLAEGDFRPLSTKEIEDFYE